VANEWHVQEIKSLPKIKWEQEIPQVIGDEQCMNCTQNFPTVLDQGILQAIGDEQYVNCAQDIPMILEQGLPK